MLYCPLLLPTSLGAVVGCRRPCSSEIENEAQQTLWLISWRNRNNVPSLSLHLPCCTARCGPRSTSLSLFSSLHLSLHVRTALRPSPTAGRHSFTSDGLIMVPPLRSLDQTWSAHSVALSPFFCRTYTHTTTSTKCTRSFRMMPSEEDLRGS